MQNAQKEPVKFRLAPKSYMRIQRLWLRYRSDPATLESFLAALQEMGVPETVLPLFRQALIDTRKESQNHEAIYRVDRYLTRGVMAVDFVLLPVVLTGVTNPPLPLFIALLSLGISGVCVIAALFVDFVKREMGDSSYGKAHAALIFLALLFGASAVIASFWHVSSFVGVVILILSLLAYLLCGGYMAYMRYAPIWRVFLIPASASPPNTDETG